MQYTVSSQQVASVQSSPSWTRSVLSFHHVCHKGWESHCWPWKSGLAHPINSFFVGEIKYLQENYLRRQRVCFGLQSQEWSPRWQERHERLFGGSILIAFHLDSGNRKGPGGHDNRQNRQDYIPTYMYVSYITSQSIIGVHLLQQSSIS